MLGLGPGRELSYLERVVSWVFVMIYFAEIVRQAI